MKLNHGLSSSNQKGSNPSREAAPVLDGKSQLTFPSQEDLLTFTGVDESREQACHLGLCSNLQAQQSLLDSLVKHGKAEALIPDNFILSFQDGLSATLQAYSQSS